MGAIWGIVLHAVGGFAAGSFYIPFKRVRAWAWESGWLVLGVSAWLVVPLVAALLTTRSPLALLGAADETTLGWTYFFGALWGIGGLTFGLSMRYLGISLGMAIALGFCAAFGTLIPPLYAGTFGALFKSASGLLTLAGVAVCLLGIAVCGRAGVRKERELDAAARTAAVAEYSFSKGLGVAVVSGVLSACFAFALEAGRPIAEAALTAGTAPIFQNNPVMIIILLGGLTTNLLYCITLNVRNRSYGDYTAAETPLVANYSWAALGGLTWYLQFFFYGMGTTFLGEALEFSSWTLHMAFIILFSNAWGIYYGEWRGVSATTRATLWWGLGLILLSTVLVGAGSYLAA